jgi:DNA excision repair protein ERCC-3
MSFHPENPLIVQSDRTILLETASPRFEEARDALSLFAEIVKSPEHIHTYRVTPLSLWNAAALGATPEEVKETLLNLSKYEVPANLNSDVEDFMARYGRLKLIKEGDELFLISEDEALLIEISRQKSVIPHLVDPPAAGKLEERRLKVKGEERGLIKSALIRVGFPVEDLAGYTPGTPMDVDLRETSLEGEAFGLRDYQNEAVGAFWAGGSERGGSGTIVLPCGAGKTVVGIGAMASVKAHTLVLTTNVTALRQWRDEILDKSDLDPEDVGEYSGDKKRGQTGHDYHLPDADLSTVKGRTF